MDVRDEIRNAVGTAADSLWSAARRRIQPSVLPAPRASTKLPNTWDSIESFYADGELGARRRQSGERDFGTSWRYGADYGPWHRLSLVIDTGELYLVNLAATDWCPEGGQVRVLGIGLNRETAEQRLEGWGEQCGKVNSLDWLDDRLAVPEVRA